MKPDKLLWKLINLKKLLAVFTIQRKKKFTREVLEITLYIVMLLDKFHVQIRAYMLCMHMNANIQLFNVKLITKDCIHLSMNPSHACV